MDYTISEKKQKEIDELQAKPLIVGDEVYVNLTGEKKPRLCKVIKLKPLTVSHEPDYRGDDITVIIQRDQIVARPTFTVGANPFVKDDISVRNVSFPLANMLSTLGIHPTRTHEPSVVKGITVPDINWNPFVIMPGGKKEYYQRPFVWDLETKQNLIESIYQHVSCGRVIIRVREWNEIEKLVDAGETEIGWHDVVDGKQRLNAVSEFINGKFPDINGNYFADLSNSSQHKLMDTQMIGYAEMTNATDADVIRQFLKMNFLGVPQSKEHISFVASLNKKFN